MQLRADKQKQKVTKTTTGGLVDGPIKLKRHRLSLTCVCVDSKNEFVYTASKDGSIIKWSLKNKKIVSRVNSITKSVYDSHPELQERYHTQHINCLAISSDNKYLASGGFDKKIRLWSPKDLDWIHTFTYHRQEVTALTFRKENNTLYSGSADRSIIIWSLEDDDNRCYVESLFGHESTITSIDALRRERILTSGGRDQSLRLWKIVESAQTAFETKHESADIARFIDDKTFVSGGEDGSLSIWTTMKRTAVCTAPKAHEISLSDSPHGRRGWITALATYPLKKDKFIAPKKRRKLEDDDMDIEDEETRESDNDSSDDEPEPESGSTGALCLIASGSCNSKINLWELSKSGSKYGLKLRHSFDCPGFVNELTFTSDGQTLVAACGQEHKFGRWWKIKGSRNCLRFFDVKHD